jgi:ABC-type Fe3+-siderophore transport system permease subunit
MFGLVLGAFLVALFVFAIARRGRWRQPRAVLFLVGFVVAGVPLGAVIGLLLGAVASISTAALYVLLALIVAFEAYRWRGRRRSRT